jgi:probable rRNA maturation factor
MTIELDVQNATVFSPLPGETQFRLWVESALRDKCHTALTIRLVDEEESRKLNARFRGKDEATNVLSFPAELPEVIEIALLGDIVICAPLVSEEARAQDKPLMAHWAHLTIHGILHLLGYDHQQAEEAELMESIEIGLLQSLEIPNPYA